MRANARMAARTARVADRPTAMPIVVREVLWGVIEGDAEMMVGEPGGMEVISPLASDVWEVVCLAVEKLLVEACVEVGADVERVL